MQEINSQSLYIITGCSKGIGKALADKILEIGSADIIGLSRTPVKEHSRLKYIQADLSDWQHLVDKLDIIFPDAGSYNKIVLVNNAAWLGELKPIGKLSNASIATAYAINSVAPFILMNAFVQKYERTAAERIIINISTSAGQNPRDGMSSYCSTKAALDMLTRVGAQEAEIRKSGITYYCVSVGATDTPMQDTIREASEDDFSTIQRFITLKKTNGLLSPEEVADRILSLTQDPTQAEHICVSIKK